MSSLPEGAIGEAVKARSAAFLRKPFKLRTVVNVVDRVLRRQG
jgi:DNA-binding NtrC family response regulator